jgi:hypothetical protein
MRLLIMTLLVAVTAACGSGAPSPVPSPVPSPTPLPAASSYKEYAVAFCSAFEALFRAVGNPDTAAGSVLSKALDAAVASHDGKAADPLAADITTELESGRKDVARAGGWPPAAPITTQLDGVFVAFEAMTAAKRAAANQVPDSVDPQAAFEQAGGVEAWGAMFAAWSTIGAERPAGVQPCANVPMTP